jgi:hypothetical protein
LDTIEPFGAYFVLRSDALNARVSVIGSYGAEGPSAISAKSANKLTGTKFKVIAAYQGGPEAVLAMERSEVDGFCAMSWSELKLRKPEWLADKRVNLLFQSGLEPHPDIPEVPLIADYARTLKTELFLSCSSLHFKWGVPSTRRRVSQLID